jgi:membrane-bound ClpP family serine protease
VAGLGISLLLAAAGAILIWAVEAEVSGFDVDAAGVILLVVGVIGAVISFVYSYEVSWSDKKDD